MQTALIRPFSADDRDWLVAAHSDLYARAEGFNASFWQLVAQIIDGFLAGHDPKREAGWIAEADGEPLGSIFCVAQDGSTAKLRLFLLVPEVRGKGLGKRLLHHCMRFAESRGYAGMQLRTHESHEAACALYRTTGWTLEASKPVHSFGQDLVEQQWRYRF